MRDHQRYQQRIQTAQEYREQVLVGLAEESRELNKKSAFGYTGTAKSPLLSHHSPTQGSIVQQYPEVLSQFSGEHTFVEDLRPHAATRRRKGPKKPIISKKMWRSVNTPSVLAGEAFAKDVLAKCEVKEKLEMAKKMARQLYERNQVRFNVSERAFNREMLETRAGQKRLGASYSFSDSLTSEGSLGPHQSMLTTSQSGRHDVLPGDLLQSIERYSRNAGSLQHEKKSILPNGGLSRDGHREQVLPRFRVDPSQRETRRVVTGGSVDRLNYSDGSLLVLMPPKVVSADPTLASKPLILRDGSKPTVHSRTLPRADRPVTHAGELSMEVQHLSAVHTTAGTPYNESSKIFSSGSSDSVFQQKSSASLLSMLSGSKEFTTSLSPRSWERLQRSKSNLREKSELLNSRPDLDALAEYQALQKLSKEQEEVREVWQRVADHREHERDKLRERAMRRKALQAKAGQRVQVATEEERHELQTYLHDTALHEHSWTGSWTQKSVEGGSLTHQAPGQPARLFSGYHRPREAH